MAKSAPENRAGFRVAIFCALPLEAECVQATFDQTWKRAYGKVDGDPNAYTFGAIGAHNVVLVHMPDMGKVNAASVAASLRPSFPNIKLGLVVGICGGVPFTPDNAQEIVLGDVIMSRAVMQYDLGRQYDDGFESKRALADTLPRPSREILSILRKLESTFSRKEMQEELMDHVLVIREKLPDKIIYPGPAADRLYNASYLHKHRDNQKGDKCALCRSRPEHICSDALSKTCDELGCDEAELVRRQRLIKALEKPNAEALENLRPAIHIGTMGSGDTVMKSGTRRDMLAKRDKLIAFEMEGAGTWEHFRDSLIIKGVCDYADSHKKKGWQYCAAATAAACAKLFLNEWNAGDRSSEQG
ncbi:hypothetical protein A1O3_08231 [Capronia epimyces CBS 606.96]|uniref:Nucleoside phosphorylase domain-containing protein n=1 Tax=Capronia epimyces CBS 606.96 TaxID=1182542 RepID=W9XRJ2_9EURO|nr:uncharacterized protein A1O3_08231 [Capronia epimyces CBS 606.96]EXJ79945.1 hypothetical protein A1O3_08231 [Capronia epimyces CBS 606.96]